MAKIETYIFLALLVSLASVLSGCASPASTDAIVADEIMGLKQFQKTVAIRTQGGSETSVMGSSSISDEDFAMAIEESIIANKLFARVIHGDGLDYLLNVTIVNISKPVFGASFTVNMEAAWYLTDLKTQNNILRDSLKSSHTTTMGESFIGVKRLRLAVEGAAKENIRLGLMAISKLHLE